MSPPLPEAASARADYSRNTLTYGDPTGEEAIRKLMSGGGPFQVTAENGFRLFANRESLEYMLLGMKARVSRGGKLWVEPIPPTHKETPVADSNANPSRDEGHTETLNR